MSEGRGFRLYLSGPARRDIAGIGRYTLRAFGEAAAVRYSALIRQALRDILENPGRPGAKARPDVFSADVRLYHLLSSRQRVSGEKVKEPRHFILFRERPGKIIEIARVLHDSRDLAQHIPA